MRTVVVGRAGGSIAVAVLAWLALVGVAAAQAPSAGTLELQLPPQAAVGQELTVGALLLDGAGAPVVGADVEFAREAVFMSSGSELALGRSATDEQGVATLTFMPRSEGEMLISARFEGNARSGAASASGAVPIATGPQLYSVEAGVRVPGVGVWLLAAVLTTVWGTYLAAIVVLLRIAHAGVGVAPAAQATVQEGVLVGQRRGEGGARPIVGGSS